MFVQTEFNKSNNNNDINNRSRDVVFGSDNYDSLFKDLDLISRFCMPICSRDNEVREIALDVIAKTVEGWLDGVGSPKHFNNLTSKTPTTTNNGDKRRLQNNTPTTTTTISNGCACSADILGNTVNDVPKEYLELITLHLPIILRLSISCPFNNVREKCQHILQIVQSRGLPVPYPVISGPSAYIDPEELPPLGTFNEKEGLMEDNVSIKDEQVSNGDSMEKFSELLPEDLPVIIDRSQMKIKEPSNQDDEFDTFGKHVANQLRQMNIYRALNLEMRIQQLLTQERINDIKEANEWNNHTNNQFSQHLQQEPVQPNI